MVKKITIVSAAAVLILVLIFTAIRTRKPAPSGTARQEGILKSPASGKVISVSGSTAGVKKTETAVSRPEEEEAAASGLLAELKGFGLPQELEAEIRAAAEEGDLEREWAYGPVAKEEIEEAGLAPSQIAKLSLDKKSQNMLAGYRVSGPDFDKMFKASLPAAGAESNQAQDLKAQVLASIGFSALEEFRLDKAEKAFESLIRNYPESESAPAVSLEYARLLSEQGRDSEARAVISDAVSRYGADEEFAALARGLEAAINDHE